MLIFHVLVCSHKDEFGDYDEKDHRSYASLDDLKSFMKQQIPSITDSHIHDLCFGGRSFRTQVVKNGVKVEGGEHDKHYSVFLEDDGEYYDDDGFNGEYDD